MAGHLKPQASDVWSPLPEGPLLKNDEAAGAVGGAVSGAAGGGNVPCMEDMARMVESMMEKKFEQRSNELKAQLASRLESAEANIKFYVMAKVCEKEETIKNDIAKIQIEYETLLNSFDPILKELHELREKYAQLQSVQDVLRKRIDEKEQRIKEMHSQSCKADKEYEELKYEADILKIERLKQDIELQKLKNELNIKDIEITRMKSDFDKLQLRLDFAEEQNNMKSGMKDHAEKLQKITKLVETLTNMFSPSDVNEAPKVVRKNGPKPFMMGSSTPSTSHNKYVKRHLIHRK